MLPMALLGKPIHLILSWNPLGTTPDFHLQMKKVRHLTKKLIIGFQ